MSQEQIISNIMTEFDKKYVYLENFVKYIETTLKTLIDNRGILIHSVNSRLKARDSLSKKIEIKNKYHNLSEITDVCGIRIITYFSDEVDKIAELLEEEFTIDTDNSIDKRQADDPTKFGYVSLHYVLSLDDKRSSLKENSNFKDLKVEIQVRTILQHAWAEIEHDLGYKSEHDIPEQIKRKFSRLAGLIELADEEFLSIKKLRTSYREEINSEINNLDSRLKDDDHQNEVTEMSQDKLTKIDIVSIEAYLDSERYIGFLKGKFNNQSEIRIPGGDFKSSRLSRIVNLCSLKNIKTIADLDKFIHKNFDNFFESYPSHFFYTWTTTPILSILEKSNPYVD